MLGAFEPKRPLASGLLVLLCIGLAAAQESGQDAQQAKRPGAIVIESFPVPAKNVPQTEILDVPAFAFRLIQLLDAVDCHNKDCTILVADFVSPDGFTSLYGTRLADELTAEIARQKGPIRTADRTL